ncbi:hypothetical protein ACFFX0_14495 [Citricoccus parietis]|uniref:Uncharacterized protein n=1 Tax=Citricoccus parietis TaxID=592307 RepID=A0ABV5G0B6_9MICC
MAGGREDAAGGRTPACALDRRRCRPAHAPQPGPGTVGQRGGRGPLLPGAPGPDRGSPDTATGVRPSRNRRHPAGCRLGGPAGRVPADPVARPRHARGGHRPPGRHRYRRAAA